MADGFALDTLTYLIYITVTATMRRLLASSRYNTVGVQFGFFCQVCNTASTEPGQNSGYYGTILLVYSQTKIAPSQKLKASSR
jgi:hypothetical protein